MGRNYLQNLLDLFAKECGLVVVMAHQLDALAGPDIREG
jgi:hypothetical protein